MSHEHAALSGLMLRRQRPQGLRPGLAECRRYRGWLAVRVEGFQIDCRSDLKCPPMIKYRAEQIGSLLRPPELLQARAAYAEGRLNTDQVRLVEDRVIVEALQKQRDVGLEILSDGEMRRGSWLT